MSSRHASSRFGWAVVEDYAVAEQMRQFIGATTINPSVDSMYKATVVFDYLLADTGEHFFDWVGEVGHSQLTLYLGPS